MHGLSSLRDCSGYHVLLHCQCHIPLHHRTSSEHRNRGLTPTSTIAQRKWCRRLNVLVCLVGGSRLCAHHIQRGGIASMPALLVLALGARKSTELSNLKVMFALMTCNLA
ncbi:hypothetical protein HBH56_103010 [Parastagonospora nodorum]|uniref:Uncharacterized protein n=1 Tax=Phaeosphaeria nodorum (strain SN15 / ATCC MYA-4574 / FGSC 10173) TaxID=321614 RepID=A0A7U2FG04_PHANO|nr:hypothetical protein HBH56_103010 [Parastagonospora nodorum]QRD04575.1 hypothetical protein JI435_201120 [Parastagonospora nodorum SN15]KAH3929637.1 hypothetical protein HBH54_127400 [Parastagonospora nodorum]KAH3951587.1 hypothetical protein HBH53_061420 [Parastagonospora nodorum]KAH4032513.1 hypothetical protein HBI09_119810 [Parastagonospora nodorum]